MIEIAWWTPYLLVGLGVAVGSLLGAWLTVDTLRQHGWEPSARWFGFSGPFDDENWTTPETNGTGGEVAPREVVRRGGTVHWESPTVVSFPFIGENR